MNISEDSSSDSESINATASGQPNHINSVFIQNSNDVTIGNRNYNHYHGPVTIIQNHLTANQTIHKYDFAIEPSQDLKIIHRNVWRAQEPKRPLLPLDLPAVHIIIAHTVSKCPSNLMDGTKIVLDIQHMHTNTNKFDDIGYNFLIGGDGSVFVGRGWNYIGAHSKLFNQRSICIAFIGNFSEQCPTNESLVAAQRLIENGVRMGKLVQNYRLYGHRQVIPTLSPGNRLYEIIQTWTNWTNDVVLP